MAFSGSQISRLAPGAIPRAFISGFAGKEETEEVATRVGGSSLTLRQMRALERAQLIAMIRRDDDELLSLIAGLLRVRH